jgi:antitoxin FitA
MASIIVRGLDDAVKVRLVWRAKQHGRSMEAEVRDILTRAAGRAHIGAAFMNGARDIGGADDLLAPERDNVARAADFE